MHRFLNSVSCLLVCLVMACTADRPIDPGPLGEQQSELGEQESGYECFDDVCRRPGAYGYYVYGYIVGDNCVTHNGAFSVSCDAPGVECPYCF